MYWQCNNYFYTNKMHAAFTLLISIFSSDEKTVEESVVTSDTGVVITANGMSSDWTLYTQCFFSHSKGGLYSLIHSSGVK